MLLLGMGELKEALSGCRVAPGSTQSWMGARVNTPAAPWAEGRGCGPEGHAFEGPRRLRKGFREFNL